MGCAQSLRHLESKGVPFDRIVSTKKEQVVLFSMLLGTSRGCGEWVADDGQTSEVALEARSPGLGEDHAFHARRIQCFLHDPRTAWTSGLKPRLKASRVKVNDHGDTVPSGHGDQTRLSTPRPVGSDVNVHHVRALRCVGASPVEFTTCAPISSPFTQDAPLAVRRQERCFPSIRRMVSEGCHDRCHASRSVAGSNMKHPAHGSSSTFAVMKWLAKSLPYRHGLEENLRVGDGGRWAWSWFPPPSRA